MTKSRTEVRARFWNGTKTPYKPEGKMTGTSTDIFQGW
jgi:hypothetical protein